MITVGADPEFFVATNNRVIPCIGLLPGTKERPEPIPGMPHGFGVQEDNVMAELTIPPSLSPNSFSENINFAKTEAIKMLSTDIAKPSFMDLSEAVFKEGMLDHPQAQEVGCAPDNNAYEMGKQNPTVKLPNDLRFAGGHIHIGIPKMNCPPYVTAMVCDALIGTLLVRHGERQNGRRAIYGTPGRYREKPYGIEYRTPSNFWCFTYMAMSRSVAQMAFKVGKFCSLGADTISDFIRQTDWKGVRSCIEKEREDVANKQWELAVHRVDKAINLEGELEPQ